MKPGTLLRQGIWLLLGATLPLIASGLVSAQSENPNDYVILAEQAVRFARSGMVASGNVAVSDSSGTMSIERNMITADGTHLVADSVEAKSPGSIFSMFANSALLPPGIELRAPCGGGPCNFPIPVFNPFPPGPGPISPGASDIVVSPRRTITLPPGDYGKLRVRGRANVVFTGGTYNFGEVFTGRMVRFLFTAPTVVNVSGRIQFGTSNVIGPLGPGARLEDVVFQCTADRVRLRPRTTFSGRLLAPGSDLFVQFGGLIKGQMIVKTAKLDKGVVLQAGFPIGPFEVRTDTPTITPVPTDTPPPTLTPTETSTPSETPTPADTATPLPTDTPIPTDTPVPTATNTLVPTATWTAVPTATNTFVFTSTPTLTPTETPTDTPTNTAVPTSTDTPIPTETATPTETLVPTATMTGTPPPTWTFTPTAVFTATFTPTHTFTPTATATRTFTATATNTATRTPSNTPTPTSTLVFTATITDTPTNTPTFTITRTATNSPTNTPVNTATQTPTATPTSTSTLTATTTKTATRTSTITKTPTITSTPVCSGALTVEQANYEQVNFITHSLGGTVNQVGGSSPGASMSVAADFNGTPSATTGVSVSIPGYLFASSVVASNLTGNSEPGNVPNVVLGAPTDITFTTAGNGGPDGTAGDGSLVMGSSGNFLTVSFGSTVCTTSCSGHGLVIFTDTAGDGVAQIELLNGGSSVASFSSSIIGGAVGSADGGVSINISNTTFDQVRISRTSGTVEIDALAVRAASCGARTLELAVCGDGTRQGGEECDDGNTTNGDGCSSDCRSEYDLLEGVRYCTLSQGGWGTTPGAGFVSSAPEILPVTIGGPGYSTTVTSLNALQAYLPRSGTPHFLTGGDLVFNTAASVIDDGSGVLGGQTMALSLALSLSNTGVVFPGLSRQPLPSLPFCTQGLLPGNDQVIGTDDDVLDLASPISGPWTIPASASAADNTVGDLQMMATQYLRASNAGPTISEVTSALDTVNRGFDGCRQVVTCP